MSKKDKTPQRIGFGMFLSNGEDKNGFIKWEYIDNTVKDTEDKCILDYYPSKNAYQEQRRNKNTLVKPIFTVN